MEVTSKAGTWCGSRWEYNIKMNLKETSANYVTLDYSIREVVNI
jgi:hypothetical protein